MPKDISQELLDKLADKYLENTSVCPFCGSDNIEGQPVELDIDAAWQQVICLECGSAWEDHYDLVGVDFDADLITVSIDQLERLVGERRRYPHPPA